ncbi:MAG TPA: RhuM family protein [bacterium]|nr:RhuM family protein [bacterium]HQO92014.1 RhuM family protein [bacterium]
MQNQIIIYQPEVGLSSLEVRLENETVWLTQNQMAELFQTDRSSIAKHIGNVYKSLELDRLSTCAKIAQVQIEGDRKVSRKIEYYNLDMIISVGYRVNSLRGTQFRIWANKVLKDYLMKGYALNQRIEQIEEKLFEHDKKFELIIQQAIPLKEGIFFDGQVFDAYELVVSFIKEAKKSIVLIDNYVDETVLSMLSKRKDQVKATIYTANLSKELSLDLKKHNAQYEPVEIKVFSKSHDRFLIIDEKIVYHIGGSLKDLGKKLFAFSRIEIDPQIILNYLVEFRQF